RTSKSTFSRARAPGKLFDTSRSSSTGRSFMPSLRPCARSSLLLLVQQGGDGVEVDLPVLAVLGVVVAEVVGGHDSRRGDRALVDVLAGRGRLRLLDQGTADVLGEHCQTRLVRAVTGQRGLAGPPLDAEADGGELVHVEPGLLIGLGPAQR